MEVNELRIKEKRGRQNNISTNKELEYLIKAKKKYMTYRGLTMSEKHEKIFDNKANIQGRHKTLLTNI